MVLGFRGAKNIDIYSVFLLREFQKTEKHNLFDHFRPQRDWEKDPYPYRGGGRGGAKPTCRIPLFLLGTPGIEIQLLKWNFKVTFLDKPWAPVRKYLRLAPEELSASMMMATQFLEGCHPYTCAASVWHVLSSSGAKRKFCLPMIWNDEECWSLRKINANIEF